MFGDLQIAAVFFIMFVFVWLQNLDVQFGQNTIGTTKDFCHPKGSFVKHQKLQWTQNLISFGRKQCCFYCFFKIAECLHFWCWGFDSLFLLKHGLGPASLGRLYWRHMRRKTTISPVLSNFLLKVVEGQGGRNFWVLWAHFLHSQSENEKSVRMKVLNTHRRSV